MVSRVIVSKLVSYGSSYIGEKDEIFFDGTNLRISDGETPGGVPLISFQNLSIADGTISGTYINKEFETPELFIKVDTTNPVTIDLDNASYTDGQKIIIKDFTGNAGTNAITIQSNAYKIDNQNTAIINLNYGSITLIFSNSTWSII